MLSTRSSPRFSRTPSRISASASTPPPSPPSQQQPNAIDTHRQRAREAIKSANERRIAFEKSSLENLANFQANIKQIVKDDIDLVKLIFNNKKTTIDE